MENIIKKIFYIIIVMNLSWIVSFARENNMSDLNKMLSSYDTLSSSFTQEKSIELLDSIIQVKGELLIKKPGLLRWQMNYPVKQIIVINDSFVLIKDEDMKVKKYSLVSTPFMKDMLKVFINILENDWDKLQKIFRCSYLEEESMITLIPNQEIMKDSIKKISIFFDKDLKHIKWLKMIENNGDYSKTIFENVILDKSIDDASFVLV